MASPRYRKRRFSRLMAASDPPRQQQRHVVLQLRANRSTGAPNPSPPSTISAVSRSEFLTTTSISRSSPNISPYSFSGSVMPSVKQTSRSPGSRRDRALSVLGEGKRADHRAVDLQARRHAVAHQDRRKVAGIGVGHPAGFVVVDGEVEGGELLRRRVGVELLIQLGHQRGRGSAGCCPPLPPAAAKSRPARNCVRIVDCTVAISSAAEIPLPATSPMARAILESSRLR